MRDDSKSVMQVKKASFAEAEELEVEYYANSDWKESAMNVEVMRKMIWGEKYNAKRIKIISMQG